VRVDVHKLDRRWGKVVIFLAIEEDVHGGSIRGHRLRDTIRSSGDGVSQWSRLFGDCVQDGLRHPRRLHSRKLLQRGLVCPYQGPIRGM
jgi:hypothetical protein